MKKNLAEKQIALSHVPDPGMTNVCFWVTKGSI